MSILRSEAGVFYELDLNLLEGCEVEPDECRTAGAESTSEVDRTHESSSSYCWSNHWHNWHNWANCWQNCYVAP